MTTDDPDAIVAAGRLGWRHRSVGIYLADMATDAEPITRGGLRP
ncbi:MAG TPA: hypothetical protein VJ914_17535 [Pseudonocardiaceae bacterium]|nr:hypothetical protein [Pseudonocardiaceae bacterium]